MARVSGGPSWRFAWNAGPVWRAEDGARVVGVVNATPDSFSDGGRFLDPAAAAAHAVALVAAGADALDVGAESTRPGHTPIAWTEEWARLGPVLRRVRSSVSVPLSVDTRHAEVARRALDEGAQAVNDVSGLADGAMAAVVVAAQSAVIVGHWRPRPAAGGWPVEAVAADLGRARDALAAAGLGLDRIALDPGLGFGKGGADNWRMLAGLARVVGLGAPVMVGASRKRFVAAVAGTADLGVRDEVTAQIALWAALSGAAMVRVHAPAPTVRALRVARALARAAQAGP